MSKRLIEMINDALIIRGINQLRDKSKLSAGTIYNIASGVTIPRRGTAYRLALACGCNVEEAMSLARECIQPRAKGAA